MATPIQVGPLALSISKTLNGMAETKPMVDALLRPVMDARYREFVVGISAAFMDHGGMDGEAIRRELYAALEEMPRVRGTSNCPIILCQCTEHPDHGDFYLHEGDRQCGKGCPVCDGDLYRGGTVDFGAGTANVSNHTMDRWALESVQAEGAA